ncbi:MAG TPA: c-type cytochrome domain-containing protein, partial [Bryobacteraceae bacterium]|nr:c-type cytochrome domain-containing protein [Bryobacteraceae bacterium]
MYCRVIPVFLLSAALAAAAPSFSRDIRPILQKRCQGCHQPASKASDLDLTTFEAFQKGGKRGAAFVAGKPDESLALKYISGSIQPRMPLGEPELPAQEVTLIKEWILDGAKNDSTAEPAIRRTSVYLQP